MDNCPPAFVCSTVPQTVDMVVRGSLPRTRRIESQRDGRWLVVNAGEYPKEERIHRRAMLFARPVEGVVLVPEPRSVELRIQRVEEQRGPRPRRTPRFSDRIDEPVLTKDRENKSRECRGEGVETRNVWNRRDPWQGQRTPHDRGNGCSTRSGDCCEGSERASAPEL